MERRTFLKIISLGLVGIAVNPFQLVEVYEPQEYFVRELLQGDILTNHVFGRYDIYNGKETIGIDIVLNGMDELEKTKSKALEILFNFMKEQEWQLSDLKPLPIWPGMVGQQIGQSV